MSFDQKFLSKVRKEFPAVEADPAGRKRAFFDNGAGTLVTRRASEMETAARVDWSANVGNVFFESKGAEETILDGRKAVADLLRAEGPETIISGESCTSLLFNLSYAMSRKFTGEGNIVATGYEHFANINPWVKLGAIELIKELKFAKFELDTGLLDMEAGGDGVGATMPKHDEILCCICGEPDDSNTPRVHASPARPTDWLSSPTGWRTWRGTATCLLGLRGCWRPGKWIARVDAANEFRRGFQPRQRRTRCGKTRDGPDSTGVSAMRESAG